MALEVPLTSGPHPDTARAEAAAQALLTEYGLAHAGEVELETLAMAKGVLVRSAPLRGSVARLLRMGRRAVLTVSDSVTFVPRWRFTVAHELGHFHLHGAEESHLSVCLDREIGAHTERTVEHEANAFAAELLMPAALWRTHAEAMTPDLTHIEALAQRYQVSLPAAAIRFVEHSPLRCAVAFTTKGAIAWTARSPSFDFAIERGAVVDARSLASRCLQPTAQSTAPSPVPASAWLSDSALPSGAELIEQCVSIPEANAALTLLRPP